jgi:leucyl-tRNA synthetase
VSSVFGYAALLTLEGAKFSPCNQQLGYVAPPLNRRRVNMVLPFDPAIIETKWQERWKAERIYEPNLSSEDTSSNFYNPVMFPCPSNELHIGHLYAYTGQDVIGRFRRARGGNVFFPFGFDSFGLRVENAAIEHRMHPSAWAKVNIENMTRQIHNLGTMIDWRSTLATHSPDYYKWNQWLFLKFLARGLIYREFGPVDWCPTCQSTLAREHIKGEDYSCDECRTPVVKKNLQHWRFRMSAYAEELLQDAGIEWQDNFRTTQRNWIGRSRGGNIRFPIQAMNEQIEVFTTRPETVYGATFLVLAPEHPLVDKVTTSAHRDSVENYKDRAANQSEIKRQAKDSEKKGVFTGGHAINPFTDSPIPIWIADYVLLGYGTGAIMGVPAGDQRDLDFARKYGLPVQRVVVPFNSDSSKPAEVTEAYTGPGVMVNSNEITGLFTLGKYTREEWDEEQITTYGFALQDGQPEAKEIIASILKDKGIGELVTSFRLQDWVLSRQRYWGTPIPIVYCQDCGEVPVPWDQLPVQLPIDVDFQLTGHSTLKCHDEFRNATCPNCGSEAERETDTLDEFLGSSWYFYRCLSPHLDDAAFDSQLAKRWLPIKQFGGQAEHALTHLFYPRFLTKVMRDLGLIDFSEPFLRVFNRGMILGSDRRRISSGRGKAVSAVDMLQAYGADVLRGYLMFIGPVDQGGPFVAGGTEGIRRFYNRVWDLTTETPSVDGIASREEIRNLETTVHQTIERVQAAYEGLSFNLGLAALMELSNSLREVRSTPVVNSEAWQEAIDSFLIMLAPIAPHLTEELWEKRGRSFSVHQQPWPVFDAEKAAEATFELIIQFNGKVRARLSAPIGINEEAARKMALQCEPVQQQLGGNEPRKVIYVPGRLVNVVR